MRAALFSNTIDARDGYGNITFELSHALSAAGVDITLFLPKGQSDLTAALQLPFATKCVLPPYVYRIYQPAGLGYFETFDVSGFDVVHDLFAFPYCIPAARSAKKYGKPLVMGAQGTHGVRPLTYWPERALLKWSYSRARAIAVPSEFTKRSILEYAKREYPIEIIHNGVKFERFQKPLDVSAIRGRYAGKKILLTVGGLWGRKGHDLVIKALPAIRAAHPNVVYVVVGDGNAKPNLEALVEELGVRDIVDFVGRKSGDELVSYFQACDVYVHTPKIVGLKFEGFGIVYLEASACGKPIVATDAGGIRDAVLDGETGLIAPDGDVGGVAERVVRILGDTALAAKLGDAGRAYARQHDWKDIARKFMGLYQRAVDA